MFRNLLPGIQEEINIFDLIRVYLDSFEGNGLMADFITDCCFFQENKKTSASDLYLAFVDWYNGNFSGPAPSQKKFGKMMGRCFRRKKKGIYFYYDVGLKQQIPPAKQ